MVMPISIATYVYSFSNSSEKFAHRNVLEFCPSSWSGMMFPIAWEPNDLDFKAEYLLD